MCVVWGVVKPPQLSPFNWLLLNVLRGPRFGKQKSVNSSFPDAVSQAQTPVTPREVWASRPPTLRGAGIQLAKWWAPSCRTLWGQWEGDGHARPSTSDPEMVARDEGTEIYQGPFPHLQPA